MKQLLCVVIIVSLCIAFAFAGSAPPLVSVECSAQEVRPGDTIEVTVRSLDPETEGILGNLEMRNLSFRKASSAMATENAFILLPTLGAGEITYTCVAERTPVSFACVGMSRTSGESSLPVPDVSWSYGSPGETGPDAADTQTPSKRPEASGTPSKPAEPSGAPTRDAAPDPGEKPSPLPAASAAQTPPAPSPAATREPVFAPRYVRAAGGARIEGTSLLGISPESGGRVSDMDDWLEISDSLRCQVYSSDGNAASPQARLSTGQTARVRDRDGRLVSRLSLVVSGDALGTGEMNVSQLVRLARALSGSEPLEGPYLLAADLSGNGRLDIGDLARAAEMIR